MNFSRHVRGVRNKAWQGRALDWLEDTGKMIGVSFTTDLESAPLQGRGKICIPEEWQFKQQNVRSIRND